jgi:hypothetical protein
LEDGFRLGVLRQFRSLCIANTLADLFLGEQQAGKAELHPVHGAIRNSGPAEESGDDDLRGFEVDARFGEVEPFVDPRCDRLAWRLDPSAARAASAKGAITAWL